MPTWPDLRATCPGLALSGVVAGLAWLCEELQTVLLGYPFIDGLVLAIMLGALIHTFVGLAPRFYPGVTLSAKLVLELAIVLLGGTIGAAALLSSGIPLVASIAAVVIVALGLSYLIARLIGLEARLAVLVACGNSICGNSAIMAVAPLVDARSEDVAAAISFTAVLGIVVVLLLPACFALLGLTQWQYGVVAGLSVYAVPQVLAATLPIGTFSAQIGTLVKLIRVLMLGPMIVGLGLLNGRRGGRSVALGLLVPWFIIGFIALMAARTTGILPDGSESLFGTASSLLTLIAMAGLGLSVDLRSVLASGGRVLLAGALSIAALISLAILTAMLLPQG
ncbi:YeiH family protein [Pelagibacterium sp.]|uniref:YeiH family protein n=1 Tax=Pelagibacterium sp. TaxID=1967288 RepID=UPI003A93752C